MSKFTVIITGGGSQLAQCIMKESKKIDDPNITYVPIFHEQMDICDKESIKAQLSKHDNILCVINCAAYTNVDGAEDNVEYTYNVNATGTLNIVQACNEIGAGIIHISTDYVYGGNTPTPYTEKVSPNPMNKYAGSKTLSEEYVKSNSDNWIIIRTSWLYSDYGHNFYKTIRDKLINTNDTLNVVYDQVGTPTYGNDLARFICTVLSNGMMNKKYNGIYNYSNQGVCSWYDFAVEIARKHGIDSSRIVPIRTNDLDRKAKRPKYSVLDKSKICKRFNIDIPHWTSSLNNMK